MLRTSLHTPTFVRAWCIRAPLTLLIVAGCAIPAHRVDVDAAISRSVATAQAIDFQHSGATPAAESTDPSMLSASVALERALATSAELQVALSRVRVAQAEADLASLLPNPILSFVLRFPEGGGKPGIEAGLAADLLTVLQRSRRSSIAGHRLEAEAARALSIALDVVAEVQAQYVDVQALEELIPVLEQRRSLLDRLREVAKARLDLGEGTRHELTALDSEGTELEVEIAQRRQELRVARIALARSVGEPSGSASWSLDRWAPPPQVPTTEATWIDAGLSARPEILAIEWELRARQEEQKLARRGVFEGATAGLDAERDDDWSAGPSIATPIPIFDSGRARSERAHALTDEERGRLVQAQRGVVQDVRSALATLLGAQENHERVVRALIPLQEQRRTEVEEAYRLGLVDVTALLFAEQALRDAQSRRVALARDVALAQNRLERSVGGPSSFRSVITPNSDPIQP